MSQPEIHAALRQSSEGRRRMNSLATSIPDPGPPDSAQPGARYIPGSVSAELEDPSMLARYSTDDQQKMLQHAQELALRRPRSETLKPSNKAAKSRWGRAGNEVLKVYKEKQKEKQKEEFADKGESHPCVLHPQSSFRMKWDLSAMIFMIYCAFSIPYRVGFDEAAEGAMFVFENIIDMFFVADLGLNFRTGYTYKQEGAVEDLVEMKPSKIACKYAKTWFIVDSLSAIPLNLILLAIDVEQQNAKSSRLTRVPKMFRLMRQVRLLKLFRVVRLLKWMKYSNLLRVVLTERLGLSPMLQRFAMLLITASTVSHMFACIWHFIHISELDSALMEGFCMNATADDDGNCVTWWTAYAGGIDTKTLDTESTSVKYLISLYWAVTTLTTVGYGDILPVREAEIWYTICVMFAGVSFYAYIAANVNNLLSQLSSSDTEVTEKMDQLNSFMTRRKVQQRNPALAHKMRSYFNRFYRVNYGAELNEEDIIKEVNVPALRTEVSHAPVVERLRVYASKSRLCLFLATDYQRLIFDCDKASPVPEPQDSRLGFHHRGLLPLLAPARRTKVHISTAMHHIALADCTWRYWLTQCVCAQVAPNLTSVECGKGDYIVRKGELANEIFFLFAGQVCLDSFLKFLLFALHASNLALFSWDLVNVSWPLQSYRLMWCTPTHTVKNMCCSITREPLPDAQAYDMWKVQILVTTYPSVKHTSATWGRCCSIDTMLAIALQRYDTAWHHFSLADNAVTD